MLTPAAMDREPQVSSPSAHFSKNTGLASAARQTEQDLTKSPEFHDLEIPDYIESSLQDFDIDELLQTDISPPGIESDPYALESTLASSTSPEDAAGSHDGPYDIARSNTLSGEQIFSFKQCLLTQSCMILLLSEIKSVSVLTQFKMIWIGRHIHVPKGGLSQLGNTRETNRQEGGRPRLRLRKRLLRLRLHLDQRQWAEIRDSVLR